LFLVLAIYPEVQRKAQEEVDRVVGSDRLPCFSDRKNMPYIEAMVSELLRWSSIAPIGTLFLYQSSFGLMFILNAGIPHRLMKDDIQNGYLIPEGSSIIVNVQ
jgi:hypothetical protein